MPITKGALRKQRSDKRKAVINSRTRSALKEAVAGMRKKPTVTNLKKAFKSLDLAAKSKIVHKNKAARIKSRLSTLVKK